MEPTTTLILTRSDVRALLSLAECIEAVEEAFRLHAEDLVPAPEILGFHVPEGGFHIKAAGMGATKPYFAAKINANFPANPARYSLPTIQGMIALYDTERGRLLAIIDSIEITIQRTAAATGVAARYLARPNASVATIIGCGVQGRAQLEALHQVRPLQRAYALDLGDRATRFAEEMGRRLEIEIVPGTEVARHTLVSDLIVTCTPSTTPLLHYRDVSPGSFVAGVGADNPSKQELDPELMARSTVVVDNLAQCLTIGDLHHAVQAGAMSEDAAYSELGAVITGRRVGRRSSEEIIVFDSTGTALQDVAAAVMVYERALEQGKGSRVELGG